MSLIFTQTDTAPTCGAAAYCSGLGSSINTPVAFQASVGGAAGSGSGLVSFASLEPTHFQLTYECVVPAGYSWIGGQWTVRINVTASPVVPGTSIEEVWLCRVNSSCVSQEVIGSATGLGLDLRPTGIRTINVTGSTVTPSAGDKVLVVVGMKSTQLATLGATITPNQDIDSPFIVTPVVSPDSGLKRFKAMGLI